MCVHVCVCVCVCACPYVCLSCPNYNTSYSTRTEPHTIHTYPEKSNLLFVVQFASSLEGVKVPQVGGLQGGGEGIAARAVDGDAVDG